MKCRRLFCFFSALCCCFCLWVAPALAAAPEPEQSDSPLEVTLTLNLDESVLSALEGMVDREDTESEGLALSEETASQLLVALEEIRTNTESSPSVAAVAESPVVTQDLVSAADRDTSTLGGTMEAIFGPYVPMTYEVTTVQGDTVITTTQLVPGLAGLDWPYIGGVVLFGCMLLGLFKLMGVVLR